MTIDHVDDDTKQIAALRALGAGQLDAWHGLRPTTARQHVEAALGPSAAGPDGSGRLGDSPASFRRYPAAPAAPYGLTVWYSGDRALLIEINTPSLAVAPEDLLGPPEADVPSKLDAMHSQLIYAQRGLVIHLHNYTRQVKRIYAMPPTTVEMFLASWLSQVEIRREPRHSCD
jgi:hypothetical protein